MQNKFKAIFIIITVQFAVAGFAAAGLLKDSISLSEERSGKDIRIMSNETQYNRVDINSTIHVHLSTSVLNTSQLLLGQTTKDIASEIQANNIKALIDGMNIWVKGLVQGWEAAEKLTSVVRGSADFKKLSIEANGKYSLFYNGVDQYINTLQQMPNGKERAENVDKEVSTAIHIGPKLGLPKVLALFNSEINWLNSQIKDLNRRVLDNGYALGIKMNASFIQKGTKIPMHLPGYDNNASGIPESYEKLRFEPNDQDKQALSEINAKASELADSIREAKSIQETLDVFGKQLLGENYDKLKNAANELKSSAALFQSVDWEARKMQFDSSAQTDLMSLKDETSNEYQTIISSIDYIIVKRSGLSSKLEELSSFMNIVQSDLDNTQALSKKDNASEALVSLLDVVSRDKAAFDKALASLSGIKISLGDLTPMESILKTKITALPAGIKIKLEHELNTVTNPEFSQLIKSVNDFADALNSLQQVKERVPDTLMNQINGAGGTSLSDIATATLIPLNSAGETTINVQEAKGREEGDKIYFHAIVYKMKKGADENDFVTDGKPLDEYDAYFELVKYGYYTSPGGGVVFISRIKDSPGETPIRGQASPSVSWMLHYRGWPKDRTSGYSNGIMDILRPALGFHTVTLHFDSTKGVELGAGITFTVFNDVIQAGYGWDINAADNQDYWYVGFGILKFGNSLGVK